jgi:dTDP-4-dehydrorhamnose 3,5-epimerase-like enzyme
MNLNPKIIEGGSHTDQRGTIAFCNDFDMSEVKRFYKITHPVIRGWRAHKIEQRWFHVVAGAFEIKLVKIDDFNEPDKHVPQKIFTLTSSKSTVLHTPVGFASSLRAIEPNSTLLVFADSGVEDIKNDDYLFPTDYFIEKD